MQPYRELTLGTTQSDTEGNPGTGKQPPQLRALFPTVSDKQLSEIEETLDAYCAIVWRVYERLERERPETIDELMRNRRIKGKVDSSK